MIRFVRVSFALGAVCCLMSFFGCSGSTGPSTVPVKGTLTIDGQPANDVTITLSPLDTALPTASGPVSNGAFQVFTGAQGKPGAALGKYKVVLAQSAQGGLDAAKAMYAKGGGGPPKAAQLSFPEKYTSATTSDKEVEIKSGSNDLKIEITK